MAITFPKLSLGLGVPNGTFSIPAALSSKAGGWEDTTTGGYSLTQAGFHSDGPSPGHFRWQRYTAPDPGTSPVTYRVLSAPCTPYRLCANASTKLYGVLHYRASGLAPGRSLSLWIVWYSSTGAVLGSAQLFTTTSDAASWTVGANEITTTPPASAHHARLQIEIEHNAQSVSIVADVAFADVGCYNGSTASYYTCARLPAHPGTFLVPSSDLRAVTDSMNQDHYNDQDRFVQRHTGAIAFSGIPDSMKQVLEFFWRMNRGRGWTGGTANPDGGRWPILLIPGNTAFPGAGIYNFTNQEFPLYPAGDTFFDPPLWSGSLGLLEAV